MTLKPSLVLYSQLEGLGQLAVAIKRQFNDGAGKLSGKIDKYFVESGCELKFATPCK